jgi:hypothetical protein
MTLKEKFRFENLGYEGLQRLGKLLKPLLDQYEKPLLNKYSSKTNFSDLHPVFIIGPPRTGSTILYQILSNSLDLLYIDNLMDGFHRNLFVGAKLSNFFFNNKPHRCYKSWHGDTFRCGLHAPSECGRFWYQWIPDRKHYVGREELSPQKIEEIKNIIYALINKFGKPFLLKNLMNSLRLEMIKQIAPQAKIIFIKRNPLDTALSILRARKETQTPKNELWSVNPKNYKELVKLDEHEMVVKQIYYIEKQIYHDQKLFPKGNFLTVHYEHLCDNTVEEVNKIKNFIDPQLLEKDHIISINRKPKKRKDEIGSNLKDKLEYHIKKTGLGNYERN